MLPDTISGMLFTFDSRSGTQPPTAAFGRPTDGNFWPSHQRQLLAVPPPGLAVPPIGNFAFNGHLLFFCTRIAMTGQVMEDLRTRDRTPAKLGCEVFALLLFAEQDDPLNLALAESCHWLRLTMLTLHPLQSSYSCDLRRSQVSEKKLVESLDTLLQYTAEVQERAADFITDAVGWKVARALHACTKLDRITGSMLRWNRTTWAHTSVRAQCFRGIEALVPAATSTSASRSLGFVMQMLKPFTRSTTTSKGHTTALASKTG